MVTTPTASHKVSSNASNNRTVMPSNVTSAVTTPQTDVQKLYRSPFVTPNHPLYLFGDSSSPSEKEPLMTLQQPQRGKSCLESMQGTSLSKEHTKSPLKLQPPVEELQAEPFQDRVLRKMSNHLGTERARRISIDLSLQNKLSAIERELEDEGGLAKRLRRMKRRFVVESVADSTEQQPSTKSSLPLAMSLSLEIPTIAESKAITSDQHHDDIQIKESFVEERYNEVVEGMEVIHMDGMNDLISPTASIYHEDNYSCVSLSPSYHQLSVDEKNPVATFTFWPSKRLLNTESSLTLTEATSACSIFETNCDASVPQYWD